MNDIEFSKIYLRRVRREAEALSVTIPKRLTAKGRIAKRNAVEGWYHLSNGYGTIGQEIWAHNAYDAKAKFIERLIEKHSASIP